MSLQKIAGFCKDCKYYEFRDIKYYPGGEFEWGFCHYYINEDSEVVGEELDLVEYFEVTSKHYCGYFEERTFNE